MKSILLIALFVCGSIASVVIDPEFAQFMVKHNKTYSVDELPQRLATYNQNKVLIHMLNERAQQSGYNTKYALNKFADISPAEFKRTHMGYRRPSNVIARTPGDVPKVGDVPSAFDWRTKGAVTKVKNQGQCGSCWAFSATEGVESAWFLAGKGLVELSPQQIVSCDQYDGGCDGGDLPTAFKYLKEKGLEKESDYPYVSGNSGDSGTCKYNSAKVVAHISGFEYATKTLSETEMQTVSYSKGPLSICVEADTWQFYSSGILKDDCGTSLDHCVQLVGWGEEGKVPYWIVRNSWGTDWGVQGGFILIERGHDLCGIAMEATYVTI